jgi:hypothetical protein
MFVDEQKVVQFCWSVIPGVLVPLGAVVVNACDDKNCAMMFAGFIASCSAGSILFQ